MILVFFRMLLAILFFSSISLKADETVSNRPYVQDPKAQLQDALDRRAARGANQIEKELNCARERLRRKEQESRSNGGNFTSLLGSQGPGAKEAERDARWECMLKNLSPHMLRSFEKFKLMDNDMERALFLSHVIVESGGFNYFSETKNFEQYRCLDGVPQEISAGDALISQVISTEDQHSAFAAGKGKGSWSMGSNRGFGPIQITGCSNRLSVIHYLNQFYRNPNLTPTWREYWTYGGRDNLKQIEGNCTAEQARLFTASYAVQNGMNADLYGAFQDSGNLGLIGKTFTDSPPDLSPSSVKIDPLAPINSAEFMFDASLAYWRGRNQDLIGNLSTPSDLYTSSCKDSFYQQGDDWQRLAVRCSTQRVRGLRVPVQKDLLESSTNSRLEYFRELVACMQ